MKYSMWAGESWIVTIRRGGTGAEGTVLRTRSMGCRKWKPTANQRLFKSQFICPGDGPEYLWTEYVLCAHCLIADKRKAIAGIYTRRRSNVVLRKIPRGVPNRYRARSIRAAIRRSKNNDRFRTRAKRITI